MLILILLLVQISLTFFLVRYVYKKIGKLVSIFVGTYFSLFFVIRPILIYYFDLAFQYVTVNETAVARYIFSGSLFVLIFLITNVLLDRCVRKVPFGSIFDFQRYGGVSISLLWLILVAGSYFFSSIKFGSFKYIFELHDQFEATVSQAGGSWYINVLSDMVKYGNIIIVGRYLLNKPGLLKVVTVFVMLAFTYFLIKPGTRTGLLVFVIAYFAVLIPAEKQRNIGLLKLALLGGGVVVALYLGNLARTGNIENISSLDLNQLLFLSVFALAGDLAPVDNAILLVDRFSWSSAYFFEYVFGALTPLSMIPTAIWPGRPRSDKDAELTRQFFGEGVDSTYYHEGSTLTFTVPGAGYADAAFFGVVVASIIYACIFWWFSTAARSNKSTLGFSGTYFALIMIVGVRLSVETLLLNFYIALMFMGFCKIFVNITSIKIK